MWQRNCNPLRAQLKSTAFGSCPGTPLEALGAWTPVLPLVVKAAFWFPFRTALDLLLASRFQRDSLAARQHYLRLVMPGALEPAVSEVASAHTLANRAARSEQQLFYDIICMQERLRQKCLHRDGALYSPMDNPRGARNLLLVIGGLSAALRG